MEKGKQIEDPQFNLNIDEEYKGFLTMLADHVEMNLECATVTTDTSLFYRYEHPVVTHIEEDHVPDTGLKPLELKTSTAGDIQEALENKLLKAQKE